MDFSPAPVFAGDCYFITQFRSCCQCFPGSSKRRARRRVAIPSALARFSPRKHDNWPLKRYQSQRLNTGLPTGFQVVTIQEDRLAFECYADICDPKHLGWPDKGTASERDVNALPPALRQAEGRAGSSNLSTAFPIFHGRSSRIAECAAMEHIALHIGILVDERQCTRILMGAKIHSSSFILQAIAGRHQVGQRCGVNTPLTPIAPNLPVTCEAIRDDLNRLIRPGLARKQAVVVAKCLQHQLP